MATPKKVMEKIAQSKYLVLKSVGASNNISQACRRLGVSRSWFYEIKRRYELGGVEALQDLPPIPKTHPRRKSRQVVKKIMELTCQHPGWGHIRLAAQARLQGINVSSGTIYSIWKKRGLNKAWKRWLWAEEQYQKRGILLTDAQIKELEKLNPCLKERHVESSQPGYLLCQDTFFVGHFKGIGRVYMQAVVDTFCSLGFVKLYTERTALAAADLLHHRVIPFYQDQGIVIEHILTDNGSEYCGRPTQHPYQLLLALQGIKHRRTKVATPRTNGFVERFNRTVLNEFFRGILRRKYYSKLANLQTDLDQWLNHYNSERPHLGYRNNGKTPIFAFNEFKKQQQKQVA